MVNETRQSEMAAKRDKRLKELIEREESYTAELQEINDRFDTARSKEDNDLEERVIQTEAQKILARLESVRAEKERLMSSLGGARPGSAGGPAPATSSQLRLPPDLPTFRVGKASDQQSAADFIELFETKLAASGVASDRFAMVLPGQLNLSDGNWVTLNIGREQS